MTIVPYLHFQGNCAEAMQFYADVFGGTDLQIARYSDAPEGTFAPPSDRVMHSSLVAGDAVLFASDFPEGMAGDPQQAVSICFNVPDVATGEPIFERLSGEGGAVIMPYGPTFWTDGFGMVKDRFGTHWMISAPMKQG